MEQEFIKAENLTIGYGKRIVVSGIDFTLEKGQILSLIGPNGAGKSTLIKTISGEIPAIEGNLYEKGDNLLQISAQKRARLMAVMGPMEKISEKITCRQVVSLGRYPYTGFFGKLSGRDMEVVTECMEKTGSLEIADCDINEISDGQRQRVLLARALCQQPQILVLDEPTSFLDIKYRIDFMDMVTRLSRREKITVIMSLHELDLAGKVSDKVLTLKGGKVDRFGAAKEVLTKEYINRLFDIDKEKSWLL